MADAGAELVADVVAVAVISLQQHYFGLLKSL